MRAPVIGTAGARILVAAADGSGELVDRSEPRSQNDPRRLDELRYIHFGDEDDVDLLAHLRCEPGGAWPPVLIAGPGAAARARAAGWASAVVVEVVLDEGAADRLGELRATEALVGVVVPPGSPPGPEPASTADEIGDAVAQGRTQGLLASALLAGVATVRTEDPVSARRVRAVIAALTGPGDGDARMAP